MSTILVLTKLKMFLNYLAETPACSVKRERKANFSDAEVALCWSYSSSTFICYKARFFCGDTEEEGYGMAKYCHG